MVLPVARRWTGASFSSSPGAGPAAARGRAGCCHWRAGWALGRAARELGARFLGWEGCADGCSAVTAVGLRATGLPSSKRDRRPTGSQRASPMPASANRRIPAHLRPATCTTESRALASAALTTGVLEQAGTQETQASYSARPRALGRVAGSFWPWAAPGTG